MIAATDNQLEFFSRLKSYVPSHLSLVDELAELLQLSHDSVYRRLRGEKPVSLNELKKICVHFNASLDELLQLKSEAVIFFRQENGSDNKDLSEYLQGILQQMKYFNSFSDKTMFYLCKDAPLFHFYIFPEIAAFKTFFWLRSVINHPEYNSVKFDLKQHDFQDCFRIGQEIIREYNEIPSVEMWNYESFNSTINQIEFYRDAGLFRSTDDIRIVAGSLIRIFDYLESIAAKGIKSLNGGKEKATIQFYINEVILGSNTILVNLDGKRMSIITYSVLKYLMSRDEQFCEDTFNSFSNLKNKSVLISQAGEKERSRYFNSLRDKASHLL